MVSETPTVVVSAVGGSSTTPQQQQGADVVSTATDPVGGGQIVDNANLAAVQAQNAANQDSGAPKEQQQQDVTEDTLNLQADSLIPKLLLPRSI